MARWLLAWTPAIAVMAMIFSLSSQPDFGGAGWASAFVRKFLGDGVALASIDWLLPYLDTYISWVAHFVEFGALAVAFYWGLRRQWPDEARALLYAWLATVLYGVTDEWHQSFVPGRYPDVRDILTDAAGAAVALLVVWVVEGRRTKSKERRSKRKDRRAKNKEQGSAPTS